MKELLPIVRAWSLGSALLIAFAALVFLLSPNARALAPVGEAALAFWLGVAIFHLTRFFRAQ